jgi:plastocyanin
MSKRSLAALAASVVFVLAACSSSTTSSAPSSAAAAASAQAPAASACKETTDAGAVAVEIIDFSFKPADVAAKVGQVIAFKNTGAKPHTATLDVGSCTTPNITTGNSDGLVFSAAGTYKFHCAIHPKMTGTIVIS